MKQEFEASIADVVQRVFDVQVQVDLSRPEAKFGDFSTNIALQIAKQVGINPREVAEKLVHELINVLNDKTTNIAIAGPGFINITINDQILLKTAQTGVANHNKGKQLLLEYSCPNAFKELHTGHLYQTVVGDALGRIFEASGGRVHRTNFNGDVGLHVAKCLFGIAEVLQGEFPEELKQVDSQKRAEWLSAAYVKGAKAYEDSENAKLKITEYNTAVYKFLSEDDHQSPLAKIYWECRQWSYDYFKDFYKNIEVVAFDKYYPESATSDRGLKVVRSNIGTVFQKSDGGAVIYEGEKVGLHTRVFITSKKLPTYETKDLGVIYQEADDFEYDKRVIITGNDQSEYMKVVFAALNDIDQALASKQNHLAHGTIRFGSGQKMSSRLGNVTRAIDVIEQTDKLIASERPESEHYQTTLAAIKYSLLRHRIGGDIAFDVEESISLEGNSGPYLQYAHARANSILEKAGKVVKTRDITDLQSDERLLVRKISEYPDIINRSINDFMPHYVANYLYELAQTFNSFYEKNRVLGDGRQNDRLQMVKLYKDTLKHGLNVLGISAPDKM